MALVRANVTFEHAGRQVRVGELFDTTSYLYAMFPTRFTAENLSAGNAATAGTLGTVVKKVEVFDGTGASLGFVPVYDAIT